MGVFSWNFFKKLIFQFLIGFSAGLGLSNFDEYSPGGNLWSSMSPSGSTPHARGDELLVPFAINSNQS